MRFGASVYSVRLWLLQTKTHQGKHIIVNGPELNEKERRKQQQQQQHQYQTQIPYHFEGKGLSKEAFKMIFFCSVEVENLMENRDYLSWSEKDRWEIDKTIVTNIRTICGALYFTPILSLPREIPFFKYFFSTNTFFIYEILDKNICLYMKF